MRKPFKKHWPDIPAHEAHTVGHRRIIFGDEDPVTPNLSAMTHGVMRPGASLPGFFCHEDKDEIIHVVRGRGCIYFEGREALAIEAGDVVCIPAGIRHKIVNSNDEELEAFFIRVRTKKE